ncbi:hypothetical protein NPIL_646041 [Nephila pilipes]|uniref:Uncharacterized protein n=1 Tax=Nephila pilipes TaxID=299642 RepID=A0A8X6TPP8_NEPPI|nr:hypothetical protein NPIL_646041 [Nephila pilipes]
MGASRAERKPNNPPIRSLFCTSTPKQKYFSRSQCEMPGETDSRRQSIAFLHMNWAEMTLQNISPNQSCIKNWLWLHFGSWEVESFHTTS